MYAEKIEGGDRLDGINFQAIKRASLAVMIGVEARNNEKRFAPHVTRLLGLFQLSKTRLLTIKIRARIKQIREAIKSGQTHRLKSFQLFLLFFLFFSMVTSIFQWYGLLFSCARNLSWYRRRGKEETSPVNFPERFPSQ